MIIKLDNKINIQDLKKYLEDIKKISPPFMKKNGPWGGWSITSSNGEIYDGWQAGEKAYARTTSEEDRQAIIDLFANSEFNTPTKIFNEYIENLIAELKLIAPDLRISRIRIALLKPHSEEEAYWHQDTDGRDAFRLHIPIETNDKCFFDYKDKRHYLPADGSIYLINVGKLHRAVNLSQIDRYHLIADAYKI